MPELTDAELTQLIKDIGLKRPRGGSERKPIAHGTFKGSRQHRYRREELCQPCRDAENAYQRKQPQRDPEARSERDRERYRAKQESAGYLTEEEWQARVAARQDGGAQ